jgi:hypothetical protein
MPSPHLKNQKGIVMKKIKNRNGNGNAVLAKGTYFNRKTYSYIDNETNTIYRWKDGISHDELLRFIIQLDIDRNGTDAIAAIPHVVSTLEARVGYHIFIRELIDMHRNATDSNCVKSVNSKFGYYAYDEAKTLNLERGIRKAESLFSYPAKTQQVLKNSNLITIFSAGAAHLISSNYSDLKYSFLCVLNTLKHSFSPNSPVRGEVDSPYWHFYAKVDNNLLRFKAVLMLHQDDRNGISFYPCVIILCVNEYL